MSRPNPPLEEVAGDLAQKLPASPHIVFAGTTRGPMRLRTEAFLTERELRVLHNLDSPPDRAEAQRMLRELKDFFDALLERSDSLQRLLSERQLVIQLYKLSGQMDFTVAEWRPPADIEILFPLG